MEVDEQRSCQVCGEDLKGELVWCSYCSTPHHADCWEFNGGCSTYGCGAQKALHKKPLAEQDKELVIVESEATLVPEAKVEVKDNETVRSLILKERQLSYRALAFLTSPAYSFWETLYKAGPANKRNTLLRRIFEDEAVDFFNSVTLSACFFLFFVAAVFVHLGPIAGYTVLAYLILCPFAHLHFKSFIKVEDERIAAESKGKPKKLKKSRTRNRRRKYRRKKKNRRR